MSVFSQSLTTAASAVNKFKEGLTTTVGAMAAAIGKMGGGAGVSGGGGGGMSGGNSGRGSGHHGGGGGEGFTGGTNTIEGWQKAKAAALRAAWNPPVPRGNTIGISGNWRQGGGGAGAGGLYAEPDKPSGGGMGTLSKIHLGMLAWRMGGGAIDKMVDPGSVSQQVQGMSGPERVLDDLPGVRGIRKMWEPGVIEQAEHRQSNSAMFQRFSREMAGMSGDPVQMALTKTSSEQSALKYHLMAGGMAKGTPLHNFYMKEHAAARAPVQAREIELGMAQIGHDFAMRSAVSAGTIGRATFSTWDALKATQKEEIAGLRSAHQLKMTSYATPDLKAKEQQEHALALMASGEKHLQQDTAWERGQMVTSAGQTISGQYQSRMGMAMTTMEEVGASYEQQSSSLALSASTRLLGLTKAGFGKGTTEYDAAELAAGKQLQSYEIEKTFAMARAGRGVGVMTSGEVGQGRESQTIEGMDRMAEQIAPIAASVEKLVGLMDRYAGHARAGPG